MKLSEYKLIFTAIALIGILLITSFGALSIVNYTRKDQPFTQLYLLGPGHKAEEYPYSITAGQSYSIFVGVANHLHQTAYYTVYIKLSGQGDQLPNRDDGIPSPLPPLYEYRFVVQNDGVFEAPMTFSVTSATFSGNQSLIQTLQINNETFNVNKASSWNQNATAYNYQLLFELWAYNSQSNNYAFDNRYVNLLINVTQTI